MSRYYYPSSALYALGGSYQSMEAAPLDARLLLNNGDVMQRMIVNDSTDDTRDALWDGAGPVFLQSNSTDGLLKRGWYYLSWADKQKDANGNWLPKTGNPTWVGIYDKPQVDALIQSLGTIYKVAGNNTLDEILALDLSDNTLKGNVYNVSSVGDGKTTGTIPKGKSASGEEEEVYIGDQILINQDGLLDNLRGFIDLTAYQTKVMSNPISGSGKTTVEDTIRWLYGQSILSIDHDDITYTPYNGKVKIPAPTANKGIRKEDVLDDFEEKENSNYRTENAILVECDDAASFLLGGNWRIPTHYEWQTLLDNSTVTETTESGHHVFVITSTINNNQLKFYAPNGDRWWCSDFGNDASFDTAYVSSINQSTPPIYVQKRYSGCLIRPVTTNADAEDAVDMGLGVYWHSCDLKDDTTLMIKGEPGDKYAWAETNTKDDFYINWSNYKYKPNGEETQCSKYNYNDGLKTVIPMTYYRWDEQGIRREVKLASEGGVKYTAGTNIEITNKNVINSTYRAPEVTSTNRFLLVNNDTTNNLVKLTSEPIPTLTYNASEKTGYNSRTYLGDFYWTRAQYNYSSGISFRFIYCDGASGDGKYSQADVNICFGDNDGNNYMPRMDVFFENVICYNTNTGATIPSNNGHHPLKMLHFGLCKTTLPTKDNNKTFAITSDDVKTWDSMNALNDTLAANSELIHFTMWATIPNINYNINIQPLTMRTYCPIETSSTRNVFVICEPKGRVKSPGSTEQPTEDTGTYVHKILIENSSTPTIDYPVIDVKVNNNSVVSDKIANITIPTETVTITCWDEGESDTKRTFNFVVNQ